MKTKQFYIKKLRLLYCILSHQYPESAGNHINTNYITWKLLKAKENHCNALVVSKAALVSATESSLQPSAFTTGRDPLSVSTYIQHLPTNIQQKLRYLRYRHHRFPLDRNETYYTDYYRQKSCYQGCPRFSECEYWKIPPQMDVALWCHKWDGLVHRVGWGLEHIRVPKVMIMILWLD